MPSPGRRQVLRVAVLLDWPSADLLPFIEGMRQVGSHFEVVPLPGGPESALREIAASGQFEALVGNFVGASWLAGLPEAFRVINLETLSALPSVDGIALDWRGAGKAMAAALLGEDLGALAFLGPKGQHAARELACGAEWVATAKAIRLASIPTLTQMQLDWLQCLPVPTGVIAATPALAGQLLRAAQARKIEVPQQLAVIALGQSVLADIQAGLEIAHSPWPSEGLGRATAELLLRPPGQSQSVPPLPIQPGQSLLRRAGTEPAFERLLAGLPGRLAEPLGVGQLAREAGLSRRSFELKFRQYRQASPHRFIRQMRFEFARNLLLESNLSVGEVSLRCGYESIHAFSAAYKQFYGVSPSHERIN